VVEVTTPHCCTDRDGRYRKQEDFAEDDFRRTIPRFNAENMPKNLELLEKFETLAAKKGTSPTKLALAWVMAQGVIPIPGTKTSDRLEENFSSRDVELTDDEVKEIRRLVDESKPHGTRYDAGHMQTLGK
jgi:aryl-alcohol dehydrogenase-like predicted oxidoreductase